jgi:hypothetical protein
MKYLRAAWFAFQNHGIAFKWEGEPMSAYRWCLRSINARLKAKKEYSSCEHS